MIPDKNYQNILIVKPSALGDIARGLPVASALRRRWPEAKISWVVCPGFAELVSDNPAIDQVIIFDKKKISRFGFAAISEIFRLARILKENQFDLVLDLQGLFRSGLISRLTGSEVRIGLRKSREFAWLFYNVRVDAPRINHANNDCFRLALAAGVEDSEPGFGAPVNERAYESARSILTEAGIDIDKGFITLLPGGTAIEKIWPQENYARLAKEIFDRYNMKCVIVGAGNREAELAENITALAAKEVLTDLTNKTSLAELTAILSFSKLVAGNDSGPLHIAAAIPKTVVGIYGPTNPDVVGPVNQRGNVIEAGADRPRQGRYSRDPAHDIGNISVEQVMEKITEVIPDE